MTPARPLATGTERPIFFDETGRRARRVRAAAAAAAAAALLWLGAIVGGPLGFDRLPVLPPGALVMRAPIAFVHHHRAHVRHAAVHRVRRQRHRRA